MDFIIGHFGYIALTFVSGMLAGWSTYGLYQRFIKPLLSKARE